MVAYYLGDRSIEHDLLAMVRTARHAGDGLGALLTQRMKPMGTPTAA
jgi:hypothetical protein